MTRSTRKQTEIPRIYYFLQSSYYRHESPVCLQVRWYSMTSPVCPPTTSCRSTAARCARGWPPVLSPRNTDTCSQHQLAQISTSQQYIVSTRQHTHQVVEGGEVYRGGHGTLHEVHGQPLVEAPHHTLRSVKTTLQVGVNKNIATVNNNLKHRQL